MCLFKACGFLRRQWYGWTNTDRILKRPGTAAHEGQNVPLLVWEEVLPNAEQACIYQNLLMDTAFFLLWELQDCPINQFELWKQVIWSALRDPNPSCNFMTLFLVHQQKSKYKMGSNIMTATAGPVPCSTMSCCQGLPPVAPELWICCHLLKEQLGSAQTQTASDINSNWWCHSAWHYLLMGNRCSLSANDLKKKFFFL